MSFQDTSSINGRITIRFLKLFTLAATAANISLLQNVSFQDFAASTQQQLRSNESVFFSIIVSLWLWQNCSITVQSSQPLKSFVFKKVLKYKLDIVLASILSLIVCVLCTQRLVTFSSNRSQHYHSTTMLKPLF